MRKTVHIDKSRRYTRLPPTQTEPSRAAPHIPDALLAWLDETYPEMSMRDNTPVRYARFQGGQRSVVLRLFAEKAKQMK